MQQEFYNCYNYRTVHQVNKHSLRVAHIATGGVGGLKIHIQFTYYRHVAYNSTNQTGHCPRHFERNTGVYKIHRISICISC